VRRLAALGLVSLVAAGCMGDDGGSVSREDYIARADGVCGTYQVRLGRLPRPVTGDPAQLDLYLERALPIAREQHEKLSELERPSGEDGEKVEELLALLDQELDANSAAQEAANAGDQAGLESALGQGNAFSVEAGRIAEELGFVVCARRA
jgi:hypothetical protein